MPYNQSGRWCCATRLNRVELFPSSLHGYKFLRLEPKITLIIVNFLETSLKNRPVEWEPQYNLTPVTFDDPQIVMNTTPSEGRKDQSKTQAKAAAPRVNDQKAGDAKDKKGAGVDRKQPPVKEDVPPPPRPEKQD